MTAAALEVLPDDVTAIGGLTMGAELGLPLRALVTAPDLGFDYEG